MRLLGTIRKTKTKGRTMFIITVPDLDVVTQGYSIVEAHEMIKDAIETLADEKGFEVDVFPSEEDGMFYISSNNTSSLLRLLIQRQRQMEEVTLALAAKKMGSTSPNAYAQYEQKEGRQPSVETFERLMKSLSPNKELVIQIIDVPEKKRA